MMILLLRADHHCCPRSCHRIRSCDFISCDRLSSTPSHSLHPCILILPICVLSFYPSTSSHYSFFRGRGESRGGEESSSEKEIEHSSRIIFQRGQSSWIILEADLTLWTEHSLSTGLCHRWNVLRSSTINFSVSLQCSSVSVSVRSGRYWSEEGYIKKHRRHISTSVAVPIVEICLNPFESILMRLSSSISLILSSSIK